MKAIVLAAGNSSRMGVPKWRLKMPDGELFLQKILKSYHSLDIETILVVNPDCWQQQDIDALRPLTQIVFNNKPDKGRLFSVKCALASSSVVSSYLIHNVDNPFVDGELIREMKNSLKNYDFVLPSWKGKGGHPVLLAKKVIDAILACCEPYPPLRTVLLDFSGIKINYHSNTILTNINTPGEYEAFMATHKDQDN